ncbi:VanZ family protein [Halomonas sp. WWR20]
MDIKHCLSRPGFLSLMLLLLFMIGALIPGELRASFEAWMGLPFSVPPVAHMLLFVGMSFCILWAYPRARSWLVLTAMLGLGALVEIIQFWIPGREPDLHDLELDMVGAVTGILIYKAIVYLRFQHS